MTKVNIERIPESATNPMARSLGEIIKAYFEVPENMTEFEEWKKSPEKQAAG